VAANSDCSSGPQASIGGGGGPERMRGKNALRAFAALGPLDLLDGTGELAQVPTDPRPS